MRRSLVLLLSAPALLVAQTAVLDEGRLDPAWFGPTASFQASKTLGFQWLKPGLDLRRRTIRLKAWEPAAWLRGKKATKDQMLAGRMEKTLLPELGKGLKRGLKESVPVSYTEGDVVLVGRIVDAVGVEDDALFAGAVSFSFDLKLVDGSTGELLGAFHDTLKGSNPDFLSLQYARWCENLGRALVPPPAAPMPTVAPPPPVAPAPAPVTAAPAPPPPAFDLEGALRRIEELKRDGLLSEAEYQALKKKAAERGK